MKMKSRSLNEDEANETGERKEIGGSFMRVDENKRLPSKGGEFRKKGY